MSPPGILAGVVGIVAAALLPILAGLVAFVFGGCRAGRIRQSIELRLRLADLERFMQTLTARLAELGFSAAPEENTYIQGSNKVRVGESPATHADKEKILRVNVDASQPEEIRVKMEIWFTDIVICDTGEKAYLKAALDYLSGAVEQMKMIPSRVLSGTVALTGGLVLGFAGYLMTLEQVQKWWFAILIVGITNVVAGVQAFLAIRKSQGKLVGIWESWAGVLLGIVGVAMALIPAIKVELTKLFGS